MKYEIRAEHWIIVKFTFIISLLFLNGDIGGTHVMNLLVMLIPIGIISITRTARCDFINCM